MGSASLVTFAAGLPEVGQAPLVSTASADSEQLKQVLVSLHIQYERVSRENYTLRQSLQQLKNQPSPTVQTLESSDAGATTLLKQLKRENEQLKQRLTQTSPEQKEKIRTLIQENQQLKQQLAQQAEVALPTAARERLQQAKHELEKAITTIHDQNKRIALLSEKVESLQSLQESQAVSLVGVSEDPNDELMQLQKQVALYEKEIAELKKANAPTVTANIGITGGAASVSGIANQGKEALQSLALLQEALANNAALSVDKQTVLNQLPWYNNTELLGNYALYLKKNQRTQEAEALLKFAIAQAPSDEALYYNLGNLYMQTNQLPEAEKAYQQVLVMNPNYNKARYNLGLLYYKQGNKAACKSTLEQFLATCTDATEQARIQQFLKQLTT
jgi:tetratricopeptide (TPR) repeat protein